MMGYELILASPPPRSRSDAVFFTLSHLSLKTSSKKARRKSRPYHNPEYESRIQTALAGVNEKKYMSLVAAAREDVSVCCTFFYFSFAKK